MSIIKALLKRTVGLMKEEGKDADSIKAFQQKATGLIKLLVSKFSEVQVFCGEDYDTEASLTFSYTPDGYENPVFFFMRPMFKETKF
tara:strand:- start:153 stop:413 length:261 start_codon:yes stop_codon:yes gene_type:complete